MPQKFKGEKYYLFDVMLTKKEAQKKAKTERAKGYKVRVIYPFKFSGIKGDSYAGLTRYYLFKKKRDGSAFRMGGRTYK